MANKTELLEAFHKVATNPAAQLKKYTDAGLKVVGCVPVYTPEEIIHSMGAVPMGVWGADTELKESKQYFPAFICSIMQSVLELGMRGTYNGISALVIPSLCDSLKCLGQNWKYAVPSIPFIPMTYPQNRNNEVGFQFVKAGYNRVIADLEKATGLHFDDAELAKSNEVYNHHNALMRKVSKLLADHPEITAEQRSDIFKSATFMRKEEHSELVEQLIAALEAEPAATGKKIRIVTSGILADSPSLLTILDENNMQVVADDVAAESRQYRTDIPQADTALDALCRKFCAMGNCSVLYDADKTRADLIVQMAKEQKADGVLVVLTKFCDPEEFDYVPIKHACEAAGIPQLLIEVDRQMNNYEQAKTALLTFKEMLS